MQGICEFKVLSSDGDVSDLTVNADSIDSVVDTDWTSSGLAQSMITTFSGNSFIVLGDAETIRQEVHRAVRAHMAYQAVRVVDLGDDVLKLARLIAVGAFLCAVGSTLLLSAAIWSLK